MLRFPCLILDHDDTVVQSERTINYPFFCYILDKFRPGTKITYEEYTNGCFYTGFTQMCRENYQFTDEELADEYRQWMDYIRTHTPPPFAGIDRIIHRQKELGGKLFVISHSSEENITRDYKTHFGIQPDEIFGWDYPAHQRKPSPYPLLQIMERYGFTKDQMLVVDDMKPAFQMASAAGVPIAYAGWGREGFPQLGQEMTSLCNYAFSSTGDLEEFLFPKSV